MSFIQEDGPVLSWWGLSPNSLSTRGKRGTEYCAYKPREGDDDYHGGAQDYLLVIHHAELENECTEIVTKTRCTSMDLAKQYAERYELLLQSKLKADLDEGEYGRVLKSILGIGKSKYSCK